MYQYKKYNFFFFDEFTMSYYIFHIYQNITKFKFVETEYFNESC